MAACRSFLILCCVLGLPSSVFGQQAPSGPTKAPALEEEAPRELSKDFVARVSLLIRAREAFHAEMAQEKAGDCLDAHNNDEFTLCYQKALVATDQNLTTYVGAIHDVLGLKKPDLTGYPAQPGPADPQLTPEQLASEFDRLEQAWRPYLDAACTAEFHQFGGRASGPPAALQCKVRLTRGHMRDLDGVYYGLLHYWTFHDAKDRL